MYVDWPPELPAPSLLMLWALLLPHTYVSTMDGVTAASSPRLRLGCCAVQVRACSALAPYPGNALWQALTDLLMLVLLQVSGHVEDAVAKGAKVTIGGKIPDLPEPYNKVSLYSQSTKRIQSAATATSISSAQKHYAPPSCACADSRHSEHALLSSAQLRRLAHTVLTPTAGAPGVLLCANRHLRRHHRHEDLPRGDLWASHSPLQVLPRRGGRAAGQQHRVRPGSLLLHQGEHSRPANFHTIKASQAVQQTTHTGHPSSPHLKVQVFISGRRRTQLAEWSS